jgi:adenylate cyclase
MLHQQWSLPLSQFQIRRRADLPGIDVDCEHLGEDRVRIQNHGSETIQLPWHDAEIEAGDSSVHDLPIQIVLKESTLEFHNADRGNSNWFFTIDRSRDENGEPSVSTDLLDQSPPASTTLAAWFESLGRIQRTIPGSQELMNIATESIIKPGGLDFGMLLMKNQRGWGIAASCIPDGSLGISFDNNFVELAAEDCRTLYHDASQQTAESSNQDSYIGSPIYDSTDKVVGVLYGVRSTRSKNKRRGIRPLEALWMQLLADSISSGLNRQQAEAEAARNRVMLEQTFSTEVAKELIDNPAVLDGCEREVTVLFADLRGFSAISEELGPRNTYKLLSDLLEHLTECVMDEGGVIIDYYGDGLAAMWNAPKRQPDHAMRACRAAQNMTSGLETVSQKWLKRIGEQLRIGIGINSGITQVGNSGSRRRLKYGPRGSAVNIASRLETATKRVKAQVLITEATRKQLPADMPTRRVCRAALAGIREPLELFELCSQDGCSSDSIFNRIDHYETVLSLYENGEISKALQLLEQRTEGPNDFCYELLEEQIQTHVERHNQQLEHSVVFDLTTTK